MHFTFILVSLLISFATIHSHPTAPAVEQNEPNLQRARPIQQFFKKILYALSPTTTLKPPPSTTRTTAKPEALNVEIQEIPNFVDFSTYLLDNLSTQNTAIKFTYLQPNVSAAPALRGNYSVISFLVPHDDKKDEVKPQGVFGFLNSLRLPWNRSPPSNTDYSQFPPVLEYFTQRIQAYFSIYKYTDESRVNNTFVVLMPQSYEAVVSSANTQSDEGVVTTTDYQMDETTTATTALYEDTTITFNEML